MARMAINSVVVGFALFSMFFGAGNIIFPPYVGLISGSHWFSSFLYYYVADVGLALVAIFAMLQAGNIDRPESLMARLGEVPAKIMMSAVVICIGPLLAVPRTGATTFSMAVVPLIGTDVFWAQVVFTIFYFAVSLAFSIRESALVDIVGRFLTPLLVFGLLLLIFLGVVSPIGPTSPDTMLENVRWVSISAGYQTLDVMAALVFGLIVVNALKAKGYTTHKEKMVSVCLASLTAGAFLFLVYGGLCYLGATVSTIYPESVNKGQLVMDIAKYIFGGGGSAVLGIVVGLACLTTSVALTGAAGTFFSTISNGKLPYKVIVLVVSVFSAVVANIGLDNIIALAAPILTFLYPGALTMVVLSLFNKHIKNDNVFRFATAGTLAVSFCEVAGWYMPDTFAFITALPFQAVGFAWVIPAVICGAIGHFVKPRVSATVA